MCVDLLPNMYSIYSLRCNFSWCLSHFSERSFCLVKRLSNFSFICYNRQATVINTITFWQCLNEIVACPLCILLSFCVTVTLCILLANLLWCRVACSYQNLAQICTLLDGFAASIYLGFQLLVLFHHPFQSCQIPEEGKISLFTLD